MKPGQKSLRYLEREYKAAKIRWTKRIRKQEKGSRTDSTSELTD